MIADRRHVGLAAIVGLATVSVVALAVGIAPPARRPARVEHAAPKRPSLQAAPAGDVAALNAAFARRVPAALAADLLAAFPADSGDPYKGFEFVNLTQGGDNILMDGLKTQLSAAEIQAARAGGIGLLWQESVLLPGLTALDNVVLPQLVAGHPRRAACSRADAWLTRVGMRERWDAHSAEVSGGQQRRVALARALAPEPRLILADEPTNDLDAHAEAEIVRILADIRAAGTTAIVIVTHDLAVAAIADRRLWMERGRITDGAGEATPSASPTDRPTRVLLVGSRLFKPSSPPPPISCRRRQRWRCSGTAAGRACRPV